MPDPLSGFAMPRIPELTIPRIPDSVGNPAKWTYERLAKQIKEFEDRLSNDEEIGVRLVQAPGLGVFHVEDMGYWGPDLIIFYGTNEHGKPIQLMQHNTQINLLLNALPKVQEQPRRIGFELVKRIENAE